MTTKLTFNEKITGLILAKFCHVYGDRIVRGGGHSDEDS